MNHKDKIQQFLYVNTAFRPKLVLEKNYERIKPSSVVDLFVDANLININEWLNLKLYYLLLMVVLLILIEFIGNVISL